jgi:hypothetical protein
VTRFVSGIILLVLSIFGFIGAFTGEATGGVGLTLFSVFLMFGLPGGLLTYFGKRAINIKKMILEASLQMLRDSDVIYAGNIAEKFGLSEIKVREIVLKAQRKGIIPFKADVK